MIADAALSETDRRILDRIQSAFPLDDDPYGRISEQAGLPRQAAHGAVMRLRRMGVFRRIGASYVPAHLGYVTSLAAASVEPTQLEEAAAQANRFPSVTHNYQRDGRFNLWFTVIAPTPAALQGVVSSVADAPGVRRIHSLPAVKTFKLRVDFAFGDPPQPPPPAAHPGNVAATPMPIGVLDRRLIRRTCGDIGTGLAPFDVLAEELGMAREDLLTRLRQYRKHGLMRRFGAILRHQKAGFSANGMAVWNVPDKRIEEVGMRLAALQEITHCYQRPRRPGWPYNLYAMIHARETAQVRNTAKSLAQENGISDFRILFSVKEFKKTSMVYFAGADGHSHQP